MGDDRAGLVLAAFSTRERAEPVVSATLWSRQLAVEAGRDYGTARKLLIAFWKYLKKEVPEGAEVVELEAKVKRLPHQRVESLEKKAGDKARLRVG